MAINLNSFKHLNKQVYHLIKFTFNDAESTIIDQEIKELQDLGVLVECKREPGEFLSNIFIRPKKDGSHRMILNLKNLNRSIHLRSCISPFQNGYTEICNYNDETTVLHGIN